MHIKPPADFAAQRKYLAEKVGELVEKRVLSSIYDAILLDEAQDYTPSEIELFKKLAGQLFAVADSRQQIYKAEGDVDPLGAIRSAVQPDLHELRYHYRNGLEICKLADRIAKDSETYQPLTPTAQYKEAENPSRVTKFQGNLDAQCQEIAKTLGTNSVHSRVEFWRLCARSGSTSTKCGASFRAKRIWFAKLCNIDDDDDAFDSLSPFASAPSTAQKGLEVRALHFAAAEYVKKVPHQRNVGFTAVTRAKTSAGDLP